MGLPDVDCCQQGREYICVSRPDRDHYMLYLEVDFEADSAAEVKFCPFCGRDLHKQAAPEMTLEELLAAIPSPVGPTTITFDVDGVLCDNKVSPDIVGYAERKPYPWASPLLKHLKGMGITVICQTARYMSRHDQNQDKAKRDGLCELKTWLNDHDIPYDVALLGKASSNLYVDDRGCRVDSNFGLRDWVATFVPAMHSLNSRWAHAY